MSSWDNIPEEQFPVNIRRLFFYRYRCRVSHAALKMLDPVRNRGAMVISREEEVNLAVHEEFITTYLTVNTMFEIWRMGNDILVVDDNDCLEIFTTITDHLQQWVDFMSRGVPIRDAPFDDLIDLDNFADKVYVHAKEERKIKRIDYFSSKQFSKVFNLSPTGQLGNQLLSIGNLESGQPTLQKDKGFIEEERSSYASKLLELGGQMSEDSHRHHKENLFFNVK